MKFKVADFVIELSGAMLCSKAERLYGFKQFSLNDNNVEGVDLNFSEGKETPAYSKIEYRFVYQDVNIQGTFGTTSTGYKLEMIPNDDEPLYMWSIGKDKFYMYGNYREDLLRFALWVGFGVYMASKGAIAIHSSAILYKERVVIFLGESGTGKSTHTRLWQEVINGATLLNDDSPIIRFVDNKIWAYGSPWSGKTPCYRNERYELAGCVRLSQAPYNKISKLNILSSYSALHPSAPPQFAHNDELYDGISATLGNILKSVPVFHLECLPNTDAAELSCKTIFGD